MLRSFERIVFAIPLCVAALCAHASTSAPCARIDTTLDADLDPAVCLRHAGVARSNDPGGAETTVSLLFAHAEERMAAGRFDDAQQTLDCAEAVLGDREDALAQYELVRRRGILDYRRERIPGALARFECALELSTAREDPVAIGRDLKNVGTALRRLGDFHGALRALTRSLEIQRASGEVGGAVLNNIADVYRELEDANEAMRYYREALQAYRGKGETVEAAHVLESMAEMGLDTGDVPQSMRWLEEALNVYRTGGNRAYQLRIYGGLIRGALALGDLAQARRWSASAHAVAGAQSMPLPASLQLQIARTERLSGRNDAAAARIRDVLASMDELDVERPLLFEELAAIQEAASDRAGAIRSLRTAHAEALTLARAQNDRQLAWLRTRFETAERDRAIAALESENRLRRAEVRQRTLMLWLTLALAAIVLLALRMLLQRRRQHERLREEAERVRQEEELARYRREADALAEDRNLLQTLLDTREDAVCLLDAEGHVLAANRAVCRLLGAPDEALTGRDIADLLADPATESDRIALSSALERMEDNTALTFELAARHDVLLVARLAQWSRGDGLIVMELRERPESAPPISGAEVTVESAPSDNAVEQKMREEFRHALVELMLALVEVWERATGTSRLELAEKSRIWRVNIDDGRLRARAMERYLVLSKLPQNPRWRDVLRSAYYVLGHCAIEPQTRAELQQRVDAVLAYTRRSALV